MGFVDLAMDAYAIAYIAVIFSLYRRPRMSKKSVKKLTQWVCTRFDGSVYLRMPIIQNPDCSTGSIHFSWRLRPQETLWFSSRHSWLETRERVGWCACAKTYLIFSGRSRWELTKYPSKACIFELTILSVEERRRGCNIFSQCCTQPPPSVKQCRCNMIMCHSHYASSYMGHATQIHVTRCYNLTCIRLAMPPRLYSFPSPPFTSGAVSFSSITPICYTFFVIQ